MLPRTLSLFQKTHPPKLTQEKNLKFHVAQRSPLILDLLKESTGRISSRVIPLTTLPTVRYIYARPTFDLPPLHRSTTQPMAMSDASSSPVEWAQLYQRGLGATTPAMFGGASAVADSTVVTTTSSATVAGASSSSSPTSHTAIEGRVAKSARRRSRASRRAPTTLLNTDTTNFRAMVQQFTGIPSGPYSSGYQPSGGPIINFGLNFSEPHRQAAAVPFRHLQQQQHHQFQGQSFQHQHQGQSYQPQQQQQQQRQSYDGAMFTVGHGDGGEDAFLQGFSNPRTNLEVTDGFFLDAMSGQMMPRPNSTENRTNGFFS